MALSWSLFLAFTFATLALSHAAEPGAPHGKRRQAQTSAGGSNALQHPPQGLQGHGYSRDRGGHGGQGARVSKGGAGLLSHRPPHPLARPEDDGTGLEGLSPVRLEMGPGRDRDRVRMNLRSPSQARENQLMGTRKGRGHGHGNGHGHGHHFEHRRQGGRREKGRHGKGELSEIWTVEMNYSTFIKVKVGRVKVQKPEFLTESHLICFSRSRYCSRCHTIVSYRDDSIEQCLWLLCPLRKEPAFSLSVKCRFPKLTKDTHRQILFEFCFYMVRFHISASTVIGDSELYLWCPR